MNFYGKISCMFIKLRNKRKTFINNIEHSSHDYDCCCNLQPYGGVLSKLFKLCVTPIQITKDLCFF